MTRYRHGTHAIKRGGNPRQRPSRLQRRLAPDPEVTAKKLRRNHAIGVPTVFVGGLRFIRFTYRHLDTWREENLSVNEPVHILAQQWDITPMVDEERRATIARQAATRGASVANSRFRGNLSVEQKTGKTDLVTEADRDAQRRIVDVIRRTYPDEPIIGEEDDTSKPPAIPDSGPAWIVDPIDGTNNYVRGVPLWATCVAVVRDGETVAATTSLPAIGNTYSVGPEGATRNGEPITVSQRTDPDRFAVVPTFWWPFDERDEYGRATREIVERFADLRRWGCAQYALATVADGGLEGVMTNRRPAPWDTVAGSELVRASGGTVTDLAGNPWQYDSDGLIASNGPCHDELLEAANRIDTE